MASELIDIQGKVKFIHAVNFNKYDKWSVTIYPEPKSLELIRDLQGQGLKNVIKKDEDGYYVQFSREPTKLMRGKIVAFAAPKVVDNKGEPMDGTKIGWGSDVTVRLDVYQHGTPNGGKAKAARWEAIRVDNLVPWTKDQLGPDEQKAHDSLVNSPKPVW